MGCVERLIHDLLSSDGKSGLSPLPQLDPTAVIPETRFAPEQVIIAGCVTTDTPDIAASDIIVAIGTDTEFFLVIASDTLWDRVFNRGLSEQGVLDYRTLICGITRAIPHLFDFFAERVISILQSFRQTDFESSVAMEMLARTLIPYVPVFQVETLQIA
jgi:hypothetical protein